MSTGPQNLPPTLAETSPIANGIALTREPLAFFARLAREAGDFAYYALSDRSVYFVNDPRLVREVLLTHEGDFAKWAFNESYNLIFGQGLIGTHGEPHRKMRKVATPPLQPSRLGRYVEAIVEAAQRRQKGWPEGKLDLTREMALITLDAIGQALFSVSLGERAGQIVEATQTLLRMSTKLGGMPENNDAFQEANATISRIAQDLIDQGPGRTGDGNLLATLIAAQRAGTMSASQLRAEIRTFILAGYVTTAQSLAAAFWLLARHPAAQETLHQETDRVLQGNLPRLENLSQLSFGEMVVLETLRLYPPVWVFGREALRDVQLDGVLIESGKELVICPWLLHRNPEFFPEPDSFTPSRWRDDARGRLPRGVYLPFSIGARSCLGEHFAMMESILVLASVAREWTFRELPGAPDPAWSPQLLYWPRRGIHLEAARRRPLPSPA
jgi:cytochrome P450